MADGGISVRCADDHDEHPMVYVPHEDVYRCPLCGAFATTGVVTRALPPQYRTSMGRMLDAGLLDARAYVRVAGDGARTYYERPSHDARD
jgi:hypothetical protein